MAVGTLKNSPSMPHVGRLWDSFVAITRSATFYTNLLYTARIVVTGVIISLVVGFTIALLCSLFEPVYEIIMPIINSTKNVPSIALFPLFIVLMGIGDEPRIAVIVWNSIYPIISSTLAGLMFPDEEIIEAAQNCGADKWQIYKYVRIPLSVPHILEGLKICAGNGFIAIVVAEMLGATKGLGYMVLWSANAFKYADMYIYILVIALIGFSINVVIEKIITITERKMYDEERKKND